jgi:hypothetical protein
MRGRHTDVVEGLDDVFDDAHDAVERPGKGRRLRFVSGRREYRGAAEDYKYCGGNVMLLHEYTPPIPAELTGFVRISADRPLL